MDMKISMLVLACGLGALCSGLTHARAEDADLDARLREALRQKMNETTTQPAAPVEQPKAVTVRKPVRKPAPEVAKPVEQPVEQPAQTVVVAAPPVVEVAQPAPTVVYVQPAAGTTVVVAADDSQTEQLRAALRARMAQEAAAPSTPPEVATQASYVRPVVSSRQTVSAKSAPQAVFLPVAPPSSLPATKEARLAQLLQQYKADQITPEQYHLERAKIIAEP
jgi:hypothetical protein